jgi:hypothetical protein
MRVEGSWKLEYCGEIVERMQREKREGGIHHSHTTFSVHLLLYENTEVGSN